MRTNLKQLRKRRHYSEEFKKDLVALFENGKFSISQLEKLYGVNNVSIYNWIYKFSIFNEKGVRVVEMKQSSSLKLKEMTQKIKDLERIVGQKQIKIDYLEKMIDIAKDEFDIDIKKKHNTSQSVGLEKTGRK